MKINELVDLALEAVKNNRVNTFYIDAEDMVDAAGLSISMFMKNDALYGDETFERIPLIEWLCTDTLVGWHLILFQDKPVALSWQPARKSDQHITWIDTHYDDPAGEVRRWALDNIDIKEVDVLSCDEDIAITEVFEMAGDTPSTTIFKGFM